MGFGGAKPLHYVVPDGQATGLADDSNNLLTVINGYRDLTLREAGLPAKLRSRRSTFAKPGRERLN